MFDLFKNQPFLFYSMLASIFNYYSKDLQQLDRTHINLQQIINLNINDIELTKQNSRGRYLIHYSFNDGNLQFVDFSKFNDSLNEYELRSRSSYQYKNHCLISESLFRTLDSTFVRNS